MLMKIVSYKLTSKSTYSSIFWLQEQNYWKIFSIDISWMWLYIICELIAEKMHSFIFVTRLRYDTIEEINVDSKAEYTA